MITHVAIEIVFAIAILFASNSFWQLVKRDKYLKEIIRNKSFLEDLVKGSNLGEPNPKYAVYAKQNEIGYVVNIHSVVESDRKTILRLKIIFSLIGVSCAIASGTIGSTYFILNFILLTLPTFSPITQSAQRSAIDHVMEIAVILYRWNYEKPTECDKFISNATSLQPLYNTIKNDNKGSGKDHRVNLEALDQSINYLRLGIFSYLFKKKYASLYGEEEAKLWAVAVLNTVLLEEPGNKKAQVFYKKNQEKILQEALTLNEDEELATAISYLYASQTISLAAVSKNAFSEMSQELGQQATRLGINIPNTYDICGSNNIIDCIYRIDNFAKDFLNDNSEGQA